MALPSNCLSCRVHTINFILFAGANLGDDLLLTAMSYDLYVAICQPLRYTAPMNSRVCCHLVAGAWISSFLSCTVVNIFLWQLTFCDSNEIDHFFYDFSPVLKLSYDNTLILQLLALTVAALWTLVPCLLTLVSYICIITMTLRIPSTTGRKKAFSTCSSHLFVVTLYYGIVIAVSVVPTVNASNVLHKTFSVFYTILTPMINPVIYCLRNKEVKECLRKAIHRVVALRNRLRIEKDTF